MKKLMAIAAVFMLFAISPNFAQDSKYMYSEDFSFAFSDDVKINVGGASKKQNAEQWEKGGKVGNHTIEPAIYKKLQDAVSSNFKIEIEKKSIGTLHRMKITDLDKGTSVFGTYNDRDRKFTFGSAKGQKQGGGQKTDISLGKGQFSEDMMTIENGELIVGTIMGKGGAVLTVGATFYYTGAHPGEK